MKLQRGLFPQTLSLVMATFGMRAREVAQKVYYSEDSIYSWKTRNPPKDEQTFQELKKGLVELLEKKNFEIYTSRENFAGAAGEIFGAYGLDGEWERICSETANYIDLVGKAMSLAFFHKRLTVKAEGKNENEDKQEREEAPEIKKLVVFDLDGTLIKGIKYSWTLLYQAVGVSTEKCRINKKKFENGELSYPEWVDYDCAELKGGGLTKEIAQRAAKTNCSLTKNFYAAIEKLKDGGCAVGIISGGADIVLYTLIPEADKIFDHNIFINRLKFDEESGALTDIEATPYDWDDDGKVRGVSGKNMGLKLLCKKYGLSLKDAVFVGDDDNDFKAMRLAGMKILYHSCDPNDVTMGTGSRRVPEGIALLMRNDLMEVSDYILARM